MPYMIAVSLEMSDEPILYLDLCNSIFIKGILHTFIYWAECFRYFHFNQLLCTNHC